MSGLYPASQLFKAKKPGPVELSADVGLASGILEAGKRQEGQQKQESPGDDTISLLDLLAVVLEHRRLIIGVTVIVGALLSTYVALTAILPPDHPLNRLPTVYSPVAQVLLTPIRGGGTASSLLALSGLGAFSGSLAAQGLGNASAGLAMELLKGGTLRDEVAAAMDFAGHYHLAANAGSASRGIFDRALKTRFDASSNVLNISYTDTDGVFATAALNAVVDALEERFLRLSMQRLNESEAVLQQQLTQSEADLKAAQQALVNYSREHGIVDIGAQQADSMALSAQFRRELATKELSLASMIPSVPETDPRVLKLKDEIAALQRFLNENTGGFRRFSAVTIPQNQMPSVVAQYVNLQYDVQLRQSIYVATRQNLESILIQQRENVPDFQVLERAQVPDVRSGPSRRRIVIVGGLAALFASVMMSFILEYFRRASVDPVESRKLRRITHILRPGFSGRNRGDPRHTARG